MTRPVPGSFKKLLYGIAVAMLLSPPIGTASPAPLPLTDKIHNLEMILLHAARQHGNEAEFARIHQELDKAEAALEQNDQASAEKIYAQAWGDYQAAVKAAQSQDSKARDRRITDRIATVKALLKQLEEINKGSDGKKPEQIETVKSLLAQAEAAQDPAKVQTLVNQAYYMLKILVKDSRNGKTLTVDHKFATLALQYADEDAYNNMHFGLLDTALEQLRVKPDAEYGDLVNNAKRLRAQAEEAAEHKDYEQAMRSLSLSTIEIKKALKHIGLSIPGF